MKKAILIDYIIELHTALESVTDRVGCDFQTAVLLTDAQNLLDAIHSEKQPKAAASVDGFGLVH